MNTLLLKLAVTAAVTCLLTSNPIAASSKSNYSTSRARPDYYSGASDRNEHGMSDDNQVDH